MIFSRKTIYKVISNLKSLRGSYAIACQETMEAEREAERYKNLYYSLKDDHKNLYSLMEKESNLRAKYEVELQHLKREELNKQFTHIKGHLPILWVNSMIEGAIDHKVMAQMSDRIRRVAPDVELILFTTGVDKLQELDDSDLQRLGLYRDLDSRFATIEKPIEQKTKIALDYIDVEVKVVGE